MVQGMKREVVKRRCGTEGKFYILCLCVRILLGIS